MKQNKQECNHCHHIYSKSRYYCPQCGYHNHTNHPRLTIKNKLEPSI